MSIIAEFRLSSPRLPLSEAIAAASDIRLQVEQAIAEQPDQPILFLWASGDCDAFEAALESDDTVKNPVRLEDTGNRRLYRVQISEQASVVMYPADLEVGGSRLAVTATVRGIDVRMRFPDRESLSRFRELCHDREVSFTLRGLYEGYDSTDRRRDGLSEKQREALSHASENGYYRVPRETGLDELADELDISPQAVSERLRRGTDQLIQRTLGSMEIDGTMYDNE